MTFRQANHRDERRRRVLIEEPGGADRVQRREPAGARPTESPRRYSEAALSAGRCRVSDLVPLRWWVALAWFVALVSSAAAMEAAYGYLAWGHTRFDISELPALDLSGQGSIATWFSSVLLLVCAVYGILIYQVRRHRVDDYRGRYRVWRWVIPLLLLASMDQVASVQESLSAVLWQLVPLPEYTNGYLLWHGSMAVVAAVVAGRLVIEMRACRLASLLLTGALGCFGVVIASRAGWVPSEPNVVQTMLLSGLVMGSRILLLMAILLYARYVHREAHDRLSSGRRERRKRRQEQPVGPGEPEEGEPSSSKLRTSRTRTQDGEKVIRADPAHTSDTSRTKTSSKRKTRQEHRSSRQEATASSGVCESSEVRGGTSRKAKEARTAGAASNGKPSPAKSSKSASQQPDDDATEEKSSKLSKAERKRLRKERRQQRQAS